MDQHPKVALLSSRASGNASMGGRGQLHVSVSGESDFGLEGAGRSFRTECRVSCYILYTSQLEYISVQHTNGFIVSGAYQYLGVS